MYCITEREVESIRQLAEDPGAGDFLFFSEYQVVRPFCFSFGDTRKRLDHDCNFDRARCANAFVSIERKRLTRVEVLREQAHLTFKGGNDRLHLIVETGLCGCGN